MFDSVWLCSFVIKCLFVINVVLWLSYHVLNFPVSFLHAVLMMFNVLYCSQRVKCPLLLKIVPQRWEDLSENMHHHFVEWHLHWCYVHIEASLNRAAGVVVSQKIYGHTCDLLPVLERFCLWLINYPLYNFTFLESFSSFTCSVLARLAAYFCCFNWKILLGTVKKSRRQKTIY